MKISEGSLNSLCFLERHHTEEYVFTNVKYIILGDEGRKNRLPELLFWKQSLGKKRSKTYLLFYNKMLHKRHSFRLHMQLKLR